MLRFVTSSLSHNIVAQYSNMRDLFGSFALLVFLVGLALAEPPTAVRRPQSKRAITGTRVFFRCIGRGQPPPFVSWYDGRSRLVKSAGRYHLRQRNRTLMIERVNDGDAGTYQCVLTDPTNPLNRRSYMAVLEVVKRRRPIIVSKPSDLTAREGDDVRLYCAATGVPRPKIRWLMHEATALASTLIHKSNRKYILRPNTLIIKNITRRDGEKVYFCRAENEEAHAQVSITIRVKVKSMGTMDTYRHGTMHMMYTSSTARPRIFGPFNNNNNNKGGTDENEQRNNDLLLDQTRHRRLPFRVGEASIRRAIEKARTEVNLAIDKTLRRLRRRGQQRSPSDILTLFRLPSDAAVELSRAGEVYEAALQEVTIIMRQRAAHFNLSIADFPNWGLEPDELAVLGQLSGCMTHARDINRCGAQLCFHLKYRSFDGSCNNLYINTLNGASLTPFRRFLPPRYENGFNQPIGWQVDRLYGGFPKPSARLVSLKILRTQTFEADRQFTNMMMSFGQFVDHDLTFTPVDPADATFRDGTRCNDTCVNESPCFPIQVQPNDPRIRHRPCIGFVRSSATCGSGTTSLLVGKAFHREQINQITAFLDASVIYGSAENEALEIRDFETVEGKLREGMPTRWRTRLLPFNVALPVDCQTDPAFIHVQCFLAGDHRANENLPLTALHTIWMREHNRIAEQLRALNRHWNNNELYHETRKIVGAMVQHITYTQWLPHVLGPTGMRQLGNYTGYNPHEEAGITNEFATAAFRFGHQMIRPFVHRLDANFSVIPQGNLPLHKAMFAPHRLVEDGGIDPILRGLFGRPMKKIKPETPMTDELTEKLFKVAHEIALDLGALNIQRARDHGIDGYNSYRAKCGLLKARYFNDLRWEIPSAEIREKLRQVYGHPDNVDLFIGGVLEHTLPGALVGPTFACILVEQFRRLRTADRFWYENPGVFTPDQLIQLRKTTFSRIVCENSDRIDHVQEDVFQFLRGRQQLRRCDKLSTPNLAPWKDCSYAYWRERDDRIFGSNPQSHLLRGKRYVRDNCATEDHAAIMAETKEQLVDKIKSLHERVAKLEKQQQKHGSI